MSFQQIDFASWEREEHFHHYYTAVPCSYSITVELDVTTLQKHVKERGLSFYPVMIHGIAKIVNRHKEFRMTLNTENTVGYFDVVHPSYTVFHPDSETFSSLWTLYQEDFGSFYAQYLEDQKTYGSKRQFEPKKTREDVFCISCIPWLSYTSFQLNLPKGNDYLLPIFTFGKFTQKGPLLSLPFSLQIHHAACDGFHVARFIHELQAWANTF